jgi:hypothetical protein
VTAGAEDAVSIDEEEEEADEEEAASALAVGVGGARRRGGLKSFDLGREKALPGVDAAGALLPGAEAEDDDDEAAAEEAPLASSVSISES